MIASAKQLPGIKPRTARSNIVVGIAEIQLSSDPEAVIVTYALGSCIAVCLYDPVRRVGGMIHYMLPLSKIAPEKAVAKPAMFADAGVPVLFKAMYARGCQKSDLVVKVAGGGKINDDEKIFDIGRRNYTVLRKLLWKNHVMIDAEDVGGSKSRTVRLEVATGAITINSPGEVTSL